MYVPFHITFQSQCFTVIGCDAAISTTDTGGVDEAVYVSDWSLTQFRTSISSDRNTISYIAFGIQQWGYADDLTKEATIYFPIAFTSPPFTLVGVEFYIANSGRNYCTNITATYFSTHSELRTSGTDSYLAIGVQQWGATTPVGRGSRTVNFHLTFPTQVYILLKTGFGNSPYRDTLSYAYGTVAAITTTSFKMFEGNVDTVKQCSWLAFGV